MDNNALNRAVAELVGWRVEPVRGGGYFFLLDPQGERRVGDYREEGVWRRAPDYTGNIGAAMSLLNDPRVLHWKAEQPIRMKADIEEGNYTYEVEVCASGRRGFCEVEEFDRLPLAICLAFYQAVTGQAWGGGGE